MNRNILHGLIEKLRGIFDNCFDQGWFYGVCEGLPVDTTIIRSIREFFQLSKTEMEEEYRLQAGLEVLEQFLSALRTFLLPELKERLKVSNLDPARKISDRNNYVRMRLLSEVIPCNIETMESCVKELSDSMYINSCEQYGRNMHTPDPCAVEI